jgi:hypothetical protein
VLTPAEWHRMTRADDIAEAISAFQQHPGLPKRTATVGPAAGCSAAGGLWVGPRAAALDPVRPTSGCTPAHPLQRSLTERLRRKRCAVGSGPGALTSRPLLLCRVAAQACENMFPVGGGCPVSGSD